jgi:hypothetical protein
MGQEELNNPEAVSKHNVFVDENPHSYVKTKTAPFPPGITPKNSAAS